MGLILKCGQLFDAVGDSLQENMLIEIEDGLIKAIYPEGPDSPDGDIIDLGRLTVMPGLIDCHDHLGLDVGDEEIQCAEPASYLAVRGAARAREMLHAGITTLRDVGEKGFIDVSWRRAIREGWLEGPRLLISGQPIGRTGGHGWDMGIEADGEAEILKAVRQQIKQDVDLIKAMVAGGMSSRYSDPNNAELSLAEVTALVEEAHRAGGKVAAHAHGGQGADFAIEAGVDSIEHGVMLTPEQLAKMADKGIYLVVTYGVLAAILRDEDTPQFSKDKISRVLDNYVRVIRQAKAAGVRIAVGGDAYHAKTHEDLQFLIEGGLTHMEALECATINGARLCGIEKYTGSLEPGKAADIIAVQGDPLIDIDAVANVRFVMKEGKTIKHCMEAMR